MISCNDLLEFVLTLSECSMRVWLGGLIFLSLAEYSSMVVECFFSSYAGCGSSDVSITELCKL